MKPGDLFITTNDCLMFNSETGFSERALFKGEIVLFLSDGKKEDWDTFCVLCRYGKVDVHTWHLAPWDKT
jgi:hypothetical protein